MSINNIYSIISPFSSLFFNVASKHDGIDGECMQVFSTTDRIHVQYIIPKESSASFESVVNTNTFIMQLQPNGNWGGERAVWSKWEINDEEVLYFCEFSLNPGVYYFQWLFNSEPFMVTDDPDILNNTTLIQYSMDSNKHRKDAVFFIDGMQRFIDFRVPGGFKDSNWSFAVDGEQYTTEDGDIVQLYGRESTAKKFTLGTSEGCPVWFAEHLNRILCCSYVYFDGVRYARKDTAAPEMTAQLEGNNAFVFTQNLQKVANLDPMIEMVNHRLILRFADGDINQYRSVSDSINRKI